MLPRLAATPNRSPEPPAKAAPAAPTPTDPTTPCTSTLSTCVLRVFLMVSHSDWKKPLPDSKARIKASSQYLPDSSAARFCSLSMSLAAFSDDFLKSKAVPAAARRLRAAMTCSMRAISSAELSKPRKTSIWSSIRAVVSSSMASLDMPYRVTSSSSFCALSPSDSSSLECNSNELLRALSMAAMASASAFKPATM